MSTGLIEPATAAPPAPATTPSWRERVRTGAWSLPETRWAALATALFGLGLIAHFTHGPAGSRGRSFSPATPPVAGSPGWPG